MLRGKRKPPRQMGTWKGIINVSPVDRSKQKQRRASLTAPLATDSKVASILQPKGYIVRVYIMQCMGLRGRETRDLLGKVKTRRCEPYLCVTLGDRKHSDKDKPLPEPTNNPAFFRTYEFKRVTLPGTSNVKIEVKNYLKFGRDPVLGQTVIDLEDRWFSHQWQELGRDAVKDTPSRLRPKPIETRPLLKPGEELTADAEAQGFLTMWVDILTPAEARAYPPIDISLPPKQEWELRVILWRADKLPKAKSDKAELADYYASASLDGHDKRQCTDLHFRAPANRASFNWRTKFPVKLPCKYSTLRLQVWDKELIGKDKICGEVNLKLKHFFRQAARVKRQINYFTEDVVEEDQEDESEYPEFRPAPPGPPVESKERELVPSAHATNDDLDAPLLEMKTMDSGGSRYAEMEPEDDESAALLRRRNPEKRKLAKRKHVPPGTPCDQDEKEGLGVQGCIRRGQKMVGAELDANPADGHWLELTFLDKDRKRSSGGRLLVSVEMLPVKEAQAMPAGKGREEPQALPKPTGRFKLSANPLNMLKNLVGPRACKAMITVFMVLLVIVLVALVIYQFDYILSLTQLINGFFGIAITDKTYVVLPAVAMCVSVLALGGVGLGLYFCAKAQCNEHIEVEDEDSTYTDLQIGDKEKEN